MPDMIRDTGSTPRVLHVVPHLRARSVARDALGAIACHAARDGNSIAAGEGGPLAPELHRLRVPHVLVPVGTKKLLRKMKAESQLVDLIRSEKVGVVHAWSGAAVPVARAAARKTAVRLVISLPAPEDVTSRLWGRPPALPVQGELTVVPSESMAVELRNRHRVASPLIQVIRPFIDLTKFDPEQVSAERVIRMADRWRVPDDLPVLFCPNVPASGDEPRGLLSALQLIGDLDYRCVLAMSEGSGDAETARLEQRIEAAGLSDRTFVSQQCDDIAAAYKVADAVVSLSKAPGAFDWVAGEAQAMGCPVIAIDDEAAREQCLPGCTAYLFKRGEAKGLGNALRQSMTLSPEARRVLQLQAGVLTRTLFDRSKAEEAYASLYKEAAGGSTGDTGTPVVVSSA